MNTSAALSRILVAFAAFAFPVLLLLGALRSTLSHAFLRYEYTRPGFPADAYGFSVGDRVILGNYALDYLYNGENIDFLAAFTLSARQCLGSYANNSAGTCPMFSQAALAHMEDVKKLTTMAFAFALGLAIAAGAMVLMTWRSLAYRRAILRGVYLGSMLTLATLATLAVIAAAAWDRAFDVFHEFFFAAGTWRFPFSDTLIRLYPERLFVDAAIVIIISLTLPCLLALYLCAPGGGKRL